MPYVHTVAEVARLRPWHHHVSSTIEHTYDNTLSHPSSLGISSLDAIVLGKTRGHKPVAYSNASRLLTTVRLSACGNLASFCSGAAVLKSYGSYMSKKAKTE